MVVVTVVGVQTLVGAYTLDADSAGVLSEWAYFPVQIVSLLGNPLFLEFVIGLSLAHAYQCGAFTSMGRFRYGLLGLGLLVSALILAFQYRDGNGLTNSGLLAAVIVVCALAVQSMIDTGGTRPQSFGLGLAQHLGDLSYSLYLVHPIVRTAFFSFPAWAPLVDRIYSMPKFFLLLSLTFIVSGFFYRFVEVPSQQLGKRLARQSAQP